MMRKIDAAIKCVNNHTLPVLVIGQADVVSNEVPRIMSRIAYVKFIAWYKRSWR